MAVRADGSTDRLSRTTSLPTASSFTMMGWFKISVDRNDYSSFFNYGTGSTKKTLQTNATGTALVTWDGMFEVATGQSLVAGTWAHVAMTFNGSNLVPYVDAVAGGSGGSGSGNPGSPIEIFQSESSEWFNGCVAAVKIYSAVLTAAEIAQEMRQYLPVRTLNLNSFYPCLSVADDQVDFSGAGLTLTVGGTLATEDGPPIPWKSGSGRLVYVAAGGGPTEYTLTAEPGAIAITGTAASLEFGRKVAANAGAVAITGTAASLERGYKVAADAGTYAITGTAAGLRGTFILDAQPGAVSITGTAVNLNRGRSLSADAGSFAVGGTAAGLLFGREVAAVAGSFAVTGTAASLEHGRRLNAESGSFSVTGTDAGLVHEQPGAYTLSAESGSFVLAGTVAGLRATRRVTADAGSYALTGAAASLARGRTVTAVAGSFAVSGTAAGLLAARRLSVEAGSWAVTGTAATLVWSGEDIVVSQVAMRGSYVPEIPVAGSYVPSIGLTGSVS
jgi:hypothetical protein